MLDLKAFEKDPEGFTQQLKRRGEVDGLEELLHLLKERRALITSTQVDQEELNQASKKLSNSSTDEIETARSKLKILSQNIKEKEALLRETENKLELVALQIPNILNEQVPIGADESANLETLKVGSPRHFDFVVKDHVEIGHNLNIIDIPRATKMSGARFAFLKGEGCRLNRALMLYFTDFHYKRGDIELAPPYLVREAAMYNVGQFPKFKEDVFAVPGDANDPMYLIPTAEVPLTNYLSDEIVEEEMLPLRYFAYSPCFRAEAGSAGKDTHGLIRQHQFEKVEMMRLATPEQSETELQDMISRAGEMLTELGLPYRVVLKCSGDTGFHAEKTYDLEVWLPAQNTYREVSSCSAFGTFQSRRSKIRFRPDVKLPKGKAKPELVVTLNGSGLPLGRVFVAILENHQQADGSVHIPKVLQPYMGGLKTISSVLV